MDESGAKSGLEQAISRVLDAYVQVFFEKHGRRILAQRTPRMVKNYRIIGAGDGIVSRKNPLPDRRHSQKAANTN